MNYGSLEIALSFAWGYRLLSSVCYSPWGLKTFPLRVVLIDVFEPDSLGKLQGRNFFLDRCSIYPSSGDSVSFSKLFAGSLFPGIMSFPDDQTGNGVMSRLAM